MRKFLGIILSLVILASCASVKKIDYQMPLQVSLVKQIKTNNPPSIIGRHPSPPSSYSVILILM